MQWLLAGLFIMLLAGCASQPRHAQNASADGPLARNGTLLGTQSDPLGAWLENGDGLAIDYPSSSLPPPSMANTALKFLGVKYRYGGNGPGQGFDCSGLVAYAAERSLGLKLPRRARDQAQLGVSVKSDELQRGDLVFFNTQGRRYSHVGIYLGDRKFVHAPRTGAKIRVEDMNIAYWRKRYNGARRLQAHNETARR